MTNIFKIGIFEIKNKKILSRCCFTYFIISFVPLAKNLEAFNLKNHKT